MGRTAPGGVGSTICWKEGSGYYYYHYNHKGDVVSVTDANKEEVAYYEYSAFGKIMTEAGTWRSPYSFATKERDYGIKDEAEDYEYKTGLIYFGARHYSPEVGRWTQRDPAGTVDGLNLYPYVGNEPANGLDAWGLVINKKNFSYEKTGKFDVVLSAMPNGRVDAEIWFIPSPGLCCDRIRMIQVARTDQMKGWYDLYHTHIAKPRWHKDPPKERKDYVRGKKWPRGHHAYLGDMPGGPLMWASQDFESCAICTAGDLKGWYLGCVQWGFTITHGKVTDDQIVGGGMGLVPKKPEECQKLYKYHAP